MNDLINTLDVPGEFDALSKLRPDEPYFLLLGRDRLAPKLVQEWASENRKRALAEFDEGKIDEERQDRELRKSTEAEAIGWSMTAFKAGDMARKVVGEPTAKTYTGFELDEDTKRRDRLHSLRIAAANALNNAVAEVTELLDDMETYGDLGELEALFSKVSACRYDMIEASNLVVPTRPLGRDIPIVRSGGGVV